MHQKNILTAGKKLEETGKALVMIHGRGSTAKNILSLSNYLNADGFTLIAPQATNNTWYPYSFLELPAHNEPWLSSAITLLGEMVDDLVAVCREHLGRPSRRICRATSGHATKNCFG